MGTENSSLSQLCSGSHPSVESQIESQVHAEVSQPQSSNTRQKPKHKPNTQNHHQIENDYESTPNYESSDTDQKYNEQEYAKMEREIKTAKNEIQRIITQYNLQLEHAKHKFTTLQDKFQIELQQKSILLQQLQDTIKQNETLKSSQITVNLEHAEDINKCKLSVENLRQQLNKSNTKQLQQTKQYEMETNLYEKCVSDLEAKVNEYDEQILNQNEENVKLKEMNIELQNKMNILNKQLQDEKQNEKQNVISIETLQNEFDEYKQSQQMEINNKIEDIKLIKSLESEIESLKCDIIELKNEQTVKDEMNQTLSLQLKNANEINELQSKTVKEINDSEKKVEIVEIKEDKGVKKEKLFSDTQRQMEILYDENARAKSLFLCCKTEWINGKDMSFTTWLSKNLNEKRAQIIWKKMKSDKTNAHIFVSLLVTTIMLYKTRLFHLRTNTKDKPDINTAKLKTYVQHLGVWCIRNKGIKTNEKKEICVEMESGQIVNEKVYRYKMSLTQKEFANNLAEWVKEYIEDQGVLENVI